MQKINAYSMCMSRLAVGDFNAYTLVKGKRGGAGSSPR